MGQSQTYPEFFKVFIPETCSERLPIPVAFIACIDKSLPNRIILKNRMGSLWPVKVVNTENLVFFMNGWEDFVKDNSLGFGDFLVFRYDGDYIFNFRIYGECECEKEYTGESSRNGKILSDVTEQDCKDDDNSNINDSRHKEYVDDEEEPRARAFNLKMVGGKAKCCGTDRGRIKKDEDEQPAVAHETERARRSPMPANPSFMTILRSYNIAKNFVVVPIDFARMCDIQVKKSVKLWVSNGKEWCVLFIRTGYKVRISQGWAAFVHGNDLKEGDICVFELIHATDTVMKVAILRR